MIRWLLLSMCTLTLAATLRAESLDAQFLAGLRERHLFRLAEVYGTERWQRDDLSDRERAELAIHISLLHTDHALTAPPELRDELWAKAEGVCIALADNWPDNPRSLLVDVQRALVPLARGEQIREETLDAAESGADEAAAFIRTAVRQLADLTAQLDRDLVELRLRPPPQPHPDALTVNELESLAANLSYQLARGQRQLALCYPRGSADRDDGLLQAVDRLKLLAEQSPPDGLIWNARVEWLAAQRELGRLREAGERLAAWSRDDPPTNVLARLAAEHVRLLLAAGRIDEALAAGRSLVDSGARDAAHADLALAHLEAAVAAWQRAQPADRERLTQELTRRVEAIRDQYGPYWSRRAQLLVGREIALAAAPDDPDMLLLAAQHLYFTGDADRALETYQRAIDLLERRQQPTQAFDVAMTAAAIERERGHIEQAGDRYHKLAVGNPRHPRAAEAHLLAIVCAAERLRSGPRAERADLQPLYEQLLAEHIMLWPESDATDNVHYWCGQLRAARHDWPAAREALREVGAESEHYPAAVRLAIECYEHELQEVATSDDSDAPRERAELLAAATGHMQPIITGPDNRWPEQWSNLQRHMAVALARLHVQHATEPTDYAERLLTAALRRADNSAEESYWTIPARALLVATLTRSGKTADAQATLEQLSTGPTATLLQTLEQIVSADNGQLAPIAIQIVELLDARRGELSDAELARLERARAATLVAAGDRTAALDYYASLAAESPDDGNLQERYAALLAESDSSAELREALLRWQQVEQRSARGGPRWRRARQARIELLTRLGDQADAEKLSHLTRLLYPDWEVGSP